MQVVVAAEQPGRVVDPAGGDPWRWLQHLGDGFDGIDDDDVVLLEDDLHAPLDPYEPVPPGDPIDRAVDALRSVDREMARVLRAVADAGPRDGLSVRRLVGLSAGATGVDIGFLDRAVQVLDGMPRLWAAFDAGWVSWSQLRGIVMEARRLSIAQRGVLDEALAGELASARVRGEPDRLVEVAGDVAARLDAAGQEKLEDAQERTQRLVLQLGFDGWGDLYGTLGPVLAATVMEALDAAADAPVAPDAPPATDDDGTVLPKAAQPVRSRATQWAEALERICASYLGGAQTGTCTCDPHSGPADSGDEHVEGCTARNARRRARPRALIITSLAELTGAATDLHLGVGSVTSRLLLRRGSGRRRITRALARALADDAELVPIFTDDEHMPVAAGDSFASIPDALRRAVIARDQGCRAPGCNAPAEHCDVHHVIPRERGGPTEITNLALQCRPDHTRITRHGWTMKMDADGTLHTRIGRRSYVTRPRLRPPRPPDPANEPPVSLRDPPVTMATDPRGDPPARVCPSTPSGCDSLDDPLPF